MAVKEPEGTPREYLVNRRDKAHELFLHYSTVRMSIIAFTIPLALTIVQQAGGWRDQAALAGYLLIGLAIVLNWFFAAYSLNHAMKSRHLDLWLKGQPADLSTAPYERDDVSVARSYGRVVLRKPPLSDPKAQEGWGKMGAWARMEPAIQLPLLIGSVTLAVLLS
jgi:hypothetical protein